MLFAKTKKAIIEKLRYFARFFVLSAVFFVFACGDQGCIEADDFGEYDTQTLEIPSSTSLDSCAYDVTKSMTDATQGSGLKNCLISGNVTIYDETYALSEETRITGVQSSSTGCKGLPGVKFQNLCVNQCIANCNAAVGSAEADTPEPAWVPTTEKSGGKNNGVTIKPNSMVYIRAIGSVTLGDKFTYPSMFVDVKDFMGQSKKNDWTSQIIDVKSGKVLNLLFSGKFNDASVINGGTTAVGQVGNGNSSTVDDIKTYNAARRLVAYIFPHPPGYDFDASQATENAGFRTVPLLPDSNMWQCTYSSSGDSKQSECSNKSYSANGYPNVDDSTVNEIFPITSLNKAGLLGKNGGMIRWNDDELVPDNYDPFKPVAGQVLCDNLAADSCTKASSISENSGKIVGDIASSDSAPISPTNSSDVSFRFVLGNNACNGLFDVVVKDAAGNDIYVYNDVKVSNDVWSNHTTTPTSISVESGQKIVVKQKADSSFTNTATGSQASCGRALAIKFAKYHDIQVSQSGLVSFAMLGGSTNVGCNIKARIINPRGSHATDITNGIASPDFYEYENFNSLIIDPLRNLTVPALSTLSQWYTATSDNGSLKAFVRNGQAIRFSPESWNAPWSAVGGSRECGIGMAMRIEPRPAMLCRGYGNDYVSSGCFPKIIGGVLVGCDAYDNSCGDINSDNFCPFTDCIKPITCTNGVSPEFQRTSCAFTALTASCNINAASRSKCDSCSDARKVAAEKKLYIDTPGVVKCYDLENYYGKVSNIPQTGYTNAQLAVAAKSKGAAKLTNFNGQYGDVETFSNSGKTDTDYNNNVKLQLQQPLNAAVSGRLKFLVLDGGDFLNYANDYNDNTSAGSAYNGSNGFKVELSSFLEFNNGEWLEAKLCIDDPASNSGNATCEAIALNQAFIATDGASGAKTINMQSKIVEVADQTGANFSAQSSTKFKFDPYGNLLRFAAPGNGACINTLVGDTYYCHTDTADAATKIRITFKIKDPEPLDCKIAASSTVNDGVIMTNSKYRPSDCSVGGNGVTDGITVAGVPGSYSCIPPEPKPPEKLSPGTVQVCTVVPEGAISCQPNSENAGQTCTFADGNTCSKQFRCVNKYANNSGKYYVTVRVKTPGSNISNIVNDVITPVVEVMDGKKDGSTMGQAERIYRLMIGDPRYQALLSMALIMMYSFYGFGYLLGVTDANISDMISKVIKISVIYLFVGEQGWEWFNTFAVKLFKNGTDYLSFLMASSFDNSPAIQNSLNNFDFYDKSILFNSVDRVFGVFFSATVQKKVAALLFASIFGWAYLIIIYYGILMYVYAVANAILLYLTAQVFISILFILGPLFFIFTLFSQTKEMFDKWLSQLLGFSLQQIFLLTTLAFFNMMMYEVIKLALGYKICWDEVWTINIVFRITLMSFWTIASLPPRTSAQTDVGNIGNPDGIPSFFSILFILVIAKLMQQFVTFMTDLASTISGGIKVSELASGVKKSAEVLQKSAGDFVYKQFGGSAVGKAVRNLDKALFDSGEIADSERKNKKVQIAKDRSNKAALSGASNKEIHNYKKKNGAEFSKLSKEDQEAKLTEIKTKAMMDAGKKRGLNEKQIEELIKDKGIKYVGENAFGFAASLAKEKFGKGGSLMKSLKDRKVDTKFSAKEAASAMKNTDKEGRQEMLDAAKRGDIYVKRSGVQAAYHAPAALKKGISKKLESDRKDYEAAKNELVKEGEVSEMRAGTGWSRPDIEKKKIRERMKNNQKARDAKIPTLSSPNALAKLETDKGAAEALEGDKFDESSYIRAKGGIVSMVFGRNQALKRALSSTKTADLAKTKERAKTIAADIKKKAASALTVVDGLRKNLGDVEKTTLSLQGEMNESAEKLAEYDKDATDETKTPEDRKKAKDDAAKIRDSRAFKDAPIKLRQAFIKRNKTDEALKIAKEKSSQLSEAATAMESMNEIVQEAEKYQDSDPDAASLDPSETPEAAQERRSVITQSQKALPEFKSKMGYRFDEKSIEGVKEFNNKYGGLKPKPAPEFTGADGGEEEA